jgi:hypothetical protein
MTTRLILLLAAALLCWVAPAAGQTIKSLGYNTTNGQVVANTGTNALTFTNALSFGTNAENVSITRANLALGSTSEPQFQSVVLNEDTNSFTITAIASVNRANLGLGLPALTNTSNVTTMRALAGSTNTNHPFSGLFHFVDPEVGNGDTTYQVVVSNGIILSIDEI